MKCDVPPFGYIDVRGKNAGFDVEIARQFARYAFGKGTSVNLLCAPTASREPLLTNDRADLVISTFTYTADREARIDFSRAYYKATGRLLVKNDGAVQKLADIAGKRVATTSGSVYDRWLKNCFKGTEVIVADTFTNAMLAFNQGRADAVMYDDAVLLPVAAADRSSKLTDDAFLEAPFGIGIKQGNTQLKKWVDSRLDLMKHEGPVLPGPEGEHRGALRELVLEERPAAGQHVQLREAGIAERGDGLLVGDSEGGGRPAASLAT